MVAFGKLRKNIKQSEKSKMKKSILKVVVLLSVLLNGNLYANQFGLSMGMKLDEIDKNAIEIKYNEYKISAPNPNNMFKTYYIRTCSKGLYSVKGIGKSIKLSDKRVEIISDFKRLENILKQKYGLNFSTKFDPDLMFSSYDSVDKKNNKNETTFLLSMWNSKTKFTTQDNLFDITMKAIITRQNTGYIVIKYLYSNYEKCYNEEQHIESGNL
ncbi:MAG: hypothetical protein DRG78_11580 [Epsilonproteobacteria bacterium]|nr:MAG: hypothetical protein DRG78_11580 [Campylobacterota bacterium]